jgi:hypothetical protein
MVKAGRNTYRPARRFSNCIYLESRTPYPAMISQFPQGPAGFSLFIDYVERLANVRSQVTP